jgi:hypothetical protein
MQWLDEVQVPPEMLKPMPAIAPPKYKLFPPLAAKFDDTNAMLATPDGTAGVIYTFARDVVVSVELVIEMDIDVGRLETTTLLVEVDVRVEDDKTTATDAPLLI